MKRAALVALVAIITAAWLLAAITLASYAKAALACSPDKPLAFDYAPTPVVVAYETRCGS